MEEVVENLDNIEEQGSVSNSKPPKKKLSKKKKKIIIGTTVPVAILLVVALVLYFVLSSLLYNPPPVREFLEVELLFSGEVDNRVEVEWSGFAQNIGVSATNTDEGMEIIVEFRHDGSEAWVEDEPLEVGNHRVRATVDEEYFGGEREIDFIVDRNRQRELSVTQEYTTYNTAELFNFAPIQYLNREAIPRYENETLIIRFVNIESEQIFNYSQITALVPGLYRVEYSLRTDTHEANLMGEDSLLLTVVPHIDDMNDSYRPWFTGFNHIFDGSARGITVDIPQRPYFEVNSATNAVRYVVRYGPAGEVLSSGFTPIAVGVYDLEVEIFVRDAPNLIIQDIGQLTITARPSQMLNGIDKSFTHTGEGIEFFPFDPERGSFYIPDNADVRDFISFSPAQTVFPKASDINVTITGSDDEPLDSHPVDIGEYTVTFWISSQSNFVLTSVLATYTIYLEQLEKSIVWSENINEQEFGRVTPILPAFSENHSFVSLAISGTANDGTSFKQTISVPEIQSFRAATEARIPTEEEVEAIMPQLAGNYTITIVVSTNGVEQTVSQDFSINRAEVFWTAQDNYFFVDNIIENGMHRVSDSEGNPVSEDLFTVYFRMGADIVPFENAGTYTVIYELTESHAHNHSLAVPVNATFRLLERSSPFIIGGSVIEYTGVARHIEFGGLNGNRQVLMYSSPHETDVEGTPVDAGVYEIILFVLYSDGEMRQYKFDFEILRRELSINVGQNEFDEGEQLDFDLSFVQEGILPSLDDIKVSFRPLVGSASFIPGLPTEVGVFQVNFSIDQRNFYLNHTHTVTIYAYGALRVSWNAPLTQVYGESHPLIVNLRDGEQYFVSIEIEGETAAGVKFSERSSTNDGSIMPTDAGVYQVLLTLDIVPEDYNSGAAIFSTTLERVEVISALIIARRQVTLTALNREFRIGDNIEHTLIVEEGGEVPEYRVSFTNLLTGESGIDLIDVPTDRQGAFMAEFTLTNPNLQQVGITSAVYRIVSEGRARISELDIALKNSTATFINIAAPTSPIPIGEAQPVEVLGLDGLDEFQQVSVYYRRTHAYQGANHGSANTGLYTPGALVAVTEDETTVAPSLAGVYQVRVVIVDILADEVREEIFSYHIQRAVVEIAINTPTTVTSSTSPIRVAGNTAQGNTLANAVNLHFTLCDDWLNHREGFTQGRARAAISQIVIESVSLVDGSSIAPITVRSSRPLTDSHQIGINANAFYAATNAAAQIPANAVAGTYRVTYFIDQANFVAETVVYFTVEARTEVRWEGLNQLLGESVPVRPLPFAWQSFSPGTPIYFEGIGTTNHPRSTTMPTIAGTFSVTTVGISDGQSQTWTTTMRISGVEIMINPDNRTVPFHSLGGNPMPISLANIGVPEEFRGQLLVSDFDISFFEIIDGEVSNTGTSIVPRYPGRFLVQFSLSDRNPNFSSNTASAIYEITARTGQLRVSHFITSQAGSTLDLGINFQDFHQDRVITFEGIDGTNFPLSTTAPIEMGIYRVTITVTTDTIVETLITTLAIGQTVQNILPTSLIFSPQGTDTSFLPSPPAASQDNWMEYRFVNEVWGSDFTVRIDGSPLPQRIPLMPGITEVTVDGRGLLPVITSGQIRVLFNNTEDAFIMAQNHMADASQSWFAIYSGWTQATVTTRTYTWRYRNDPRDTVNDFFFQTVNAGNNAPVVGDRTRMGLRASRAAGSDTWQTRFSDTTARRDFFSTYNPLLNWHRFSDISNVDRSPEAYRNHFGFTPDGLTGYVVNASTVTNNFRQNLTINTANQYTFQFTFNAGSMDRVHIQIARFSGQTFGRAVSLRMNFTLDIFGRVTEIFHVDAYEIAIMGGQLATHTGLETFFHNPAEFPNVPIWRDPRPGQTGTQTANITFF